MSTQYQHSTLGLLFWGLEMGPWVWEWSWGPNGQEQPKDESTMGSGQHLVYKVQHKHLPNV